MVSRISWITNWIATARYKAAMNLPTSMMEARPLWAMVLASRAVTAQGM